MPCKGKQCASNPVQNFGSNQFRSSALSKSATSIFTTAEVVIPRGVDEIPDLKEILQRYTNTGVIQNEIPAKLAKEHGIKPPGVRTIQKYMKDLGVTTSRRNGLSEQQEADAVAMIAQDDPLGRWGGRLVKEKLGRESIHIPRNKILEIQKAQNPEAVAARHPTTRKPHHSGIWSIGPNEEWGVDGHEKILQSMGIAVWGVIDKYSRIEIGLWAMPNARVREVPPALFLRSVKKQKGMPLSVTSDMGTEVGILISLVTAMRAKYQPFLDEDKIPSFRTVKSIFNITREQGWRAIWEKELGNVLHEYRLGLEAAGFVETDPIHHAISRWLWGKVVQNRLDSILEENQNHRIRKQLQTLLPSGARRIDMYTNPQENGGGTDQIIKVDQDSIDKLLEEYDRPDLLAFGTPEQVAMCLSLFNAIGSPKLSARVGWNVFTAMVECYIAHLEGNVVV